MWWRLERVTPVPRVGEDGDREREAWHQVIHRTNQAISSSLTEQLVNHQLATPARPISRTMMSSYGVTLSLILRLFLAKVVNYSEASVAHVSILLCFTKKKIQTLIYFFHRSLKFSCQFCHEFLWVFFGLKKVCFLIWRLMSLRLRWWCLWWR